MTLCIGWDVGGWHGKRDGLAALALSPDGAVDPVGRHCTVSLGDLVARGALTLQMMAERLELGTTFGSATRLILAVDAPLGFPRAFVQAASSRFDAVPSLNVPLTEGWIKNPLAYRETDRYVFEKTEKQPLSPSLNALANNTSKARAACACLRRKDSRVRIAPFESDDSEVAVIEVYPALWKKDMSGVAVEMLDRVGNTDKDQKDAYLAALTAACYEQARTAAGGQSLPSVMTPPPGLSEVVRVEGWIYAPVLRGR